MKNRSIYLFLFFVGLVCPKSFYGQKLTSDPYSSYAYGGANNGVVGAIAGEACVTTTGAAQYSIPLDIPEGIGSLTPRLAIAYSSSSNDGYLGWGFSLQGLSQVSRAVTPLFTTNVSYAVTLSDDDHYAIDGNLLYMRSSSYGKFYYFKNDDNTLFKSDDAFSSFTGHRSDGSTVVYGGTSNSRVYAQGKYSTKVLLWLLNEVCDKNGNYYTVTYQQNEGGEHYPLRIDYSGNKNAGIAPSKSIRFTYTERPVTNVTYIKSSQLHTAHKLKTISIYNGENCIKKYDLDYASTPVTGIPILKSITEYGSDNTVFYNPTKFEWSVLDNYAITQASSGRYEELEKAEIYTGDFNGDGKTDMIAVPGSGAKWKEWRLFLSQGDGRMTFETSGEIDSKYKQLVTGDFNGDGKDEFLQIVKGSRASMSSDSPAAIQVLNDSGDESDSIVKISMVSPVEHIAMSLAENDSAQAISLQTQSADIQYHVWTHYESSDCEVVSGDFNGDGVSDLLIYYPGETTYKIINSLWSNSTSSIQGFGTTTKLESEYDWEDVYLGDFNGDGKTDIMNVSKSGYNLMIADENGIPRYAKKGVWPQSDYRLSFGDFNGDGKTDILATGYGDTDHWSSFGMNIWTGEDFEKYTIPHYFNSLDYVVYVADINGDGKDDFYAIKKEADRINPTATYYYINEGDGTSYIENTVLQANAMEYNTYYLGDFDGNGRTDIIGIGVDKNYRSPSGQTRNNKGLYTSYLSPAGFSHILTKITDGLGKETKFEYSYMTDLNIHTPKTFTYPLKSVSYPLEIVSYMRQSDGLGGYRTKRYLYEGGRSHSRGMGFIGFEKFIEFDLTENTSTVQNFEVQGGLCYVGLKSKTDMIAGSLHSVTEYTNKVVGIGLGTNTFCPLYFKEKFYEHESGIYQGCYEERKTMDKYGNTTSVTEIFNGSDSIVTTMDYFTIDDRDRWPVKWTLGFPTSSTKEYFRDGVPNITTSQTMQYDDKFNLTQCKNFGNNELLSTESMVYDAAGNVTSKTKSSGSLSSTEKTVYSGLLNKTSTEDAENYVSSFSYDSSTGMMTKSIDATGTTIDYTYDKMLRTVKSLKNSKIESCELLRWSNGIADAPANSVYLTYKETAGNAPVVEFYNLLGNKIREVKTLFGGKKAYTDMEYDAAGRLIALSNPYFLGASPLYTYYEYDDLGRVSNVEYPTGAADSYYYYHNMIGGLRTDIVDRMGHQMSKETNARGELISVTDADDNQTVYEYDAIGNCIAITTPSKSIEMEYDNSGNRVMISDPDMGTYKFSYDGFGNPTKRIHQDSGAEISYSYDKLGRVVRKTTPENDISTVYHASILGAVSTISDAVTGISTKRSYNKFGQQTGEERKIGKESWSISFMYDAFDRQYRNSYPNLSEVYNEYDSYGNVKKVHLSTPESPICAWELNKVDEYNRPVSYTLGNGIVVTKEYDSESGYPSSVSHGNLVTQEYQYDFKGNMTSRYDSRCGKTEKFKYDALDRLTKIYTDNTLTDEIGYDEAGNIVSRTAVGSITYESGSNRINSINCVSTAALTPWDEIIYNTDRKVTKVRKGNETLDIIYGTDGNRFRSTFTSGQGKCDVTYFGNLYQEAQNEGEDWMSDRIFVYAGNECVAINSYGDGAETIFLHNDILGSPIAYSDYNGNLVSECSYDAWGRRRNPRDWTQYIRRQSFEANDRYGFTGHEHIDIADMINMNGRFYDPVIGRFISPDPYVQDPENPLNFNRYAYCLNNPLKYTDPSGEFFLENVIRVLWSKILKGSVKYQWNKLSNAYKIQKNMFTTNRLKNFWGRAWELASRFTWQLPQEVLGITLAHGYNTFGHVKKVSHAYGALVMSTPYFGESGAITLGNVIIGNSSLEADPNNATFQHEYGHYMQSQIFGVAYTSVIGVPSLVSSALKQKRPSDGRSRHRFRWFEKDANKRAFNYFNEHTPDLIWDYVGNPLNDSAEEPTTKASQTTSSDSNSSIKNVELIDVLSIKF